MLYNITILIFQLITLILIAGMLLLILNKKCKLFFDIMTCARKDIKAMYETEMKD